MPGMFSYSKAAVERAMKVEEVMMRAWAKKITWWPAAEILGITDRHLRRIREGYEKLRYFSLLDKRRGQPSPKRVPVAVVSRFWALYRDKSFVGDELVFLRCHPYPHARKGRCRS